MTKGDSMKISITTSELNEMINLVLKPERMNSMFDLRKNIQTYANLEMIQLTVLNSCGKGFIECLDEQVIKMQKTLMFLLIMLILYL